MRTRTILCVATYFKGDAFLRECHRLGATVVLLTSDSLAEAAWPRDAIAEIHTIPRTATEADIRRVVASVARRHSIARVAALDDFDVELGAMLREFLQLPGFGRTVASRFRDKLAMRTTAKKLGLAVPEFTGVFNDDEVNAWTGRVPPPWVLKPRSSAAATGIKKIASAADLWPALHGAGDDRPACLLEGFVAGEVFHVDSIVRNGKVVLAVPSKYGRPPMQVAHQGGAYISRTLLRGSSDEKSLTEINKKLVKTLKLDQGATHAEFIKSDAEGKFYFLEIAARVGGAYIADVLEAASGISLWREWARIEIANGASSAKIKPLRKEYAGIILSLAKQETPDTATYNDEEIVYRVNKRHHAGIIVRSPKHERVNELLDRYAQRFVDDFVAVVPPPERPE